MIDPSSSEDESDEEFVPRRKPGKKQTLVTQQSDIKASTLPSVDAPVIAHLPSRVQDVESKPQRSR